MIIKWDIKHSIGNEKLDLQHKHLFELAAQIESISDKPVSRADLKDLLFNFLNSMKTHFNDEEAYMESIKYPELKEHRATHKNILKSIVELISYVKTTNDLKEKLNLVSKQWLIDHILYEDMKIEQFVRSHSNVENADLKDFTLEEFDFDNFDFEEVAIEQIYLYTCSCKDKIHKVKKQIHEKIRLKLSSIVCKTCKEKIQFKKEA